MSAQGDSAFRKLAVNRRALHDYFVLEHLEAGIELRGTEVKSVRQAELSLAGSFARIDGGDLYLHNVTISPYEFGNRFNHESARPRRLLVHRREITRLAVHAQQKGHALIPLSVYIKRGRVKVDLGICRGKQLADKRETLRRKTAEREADRAIAQARRN